MKRDMTKEFSSTERRQACAFLTTCCSFPYSIIVDDQKPKTGKDKMGTGSHSGTGGMEVVLCVYAGLTLLTRFSTGKRYPMCKLLLSVFLFSRVLVGLVRR